MVEGVLGMGDVLFKLGGLMFGKLGGDVVDEAGGVKLLVACGALDVYGASKQGGCAW